MSIGLMIVLVLLASWAVLATVLLFLLISILREL